MNNKLLNDGFQGDKYRICNNWFDFIPITDEPIKYLEIGLFNGANIISVANSYGIHSDSKLYGIDPYIDYDEYDEYKKIQDNNYENFKYNLKNNNVENKTIHLRDFSNQALKKFDNSMFDIIYIDGNHETKYVLEDAVLSFNLLKINGYMIFDDYQTGLVETTKGIDSFLNCYEGYFKLLGVKENQLFIQKIK